MIRFIKYFVFALLLISLSATAKARTAPEIPADGCGRPVNPVAPKYPMEALRKKRKGWVVVEFSIGSTGEVTSARVSDSYPSVLFDDSALEAIKATTFNPQADAVAGCKKLVVFSIGRWD